MNEMTKNILLWVVIGIILMSVFSNFTPTTAPKEMSYSDFIQNVERGSVSEVKIEGRVISGLSTEGKKFTSYSPETDNRALIGELLDNQVKIVGEPPKQQSLLVQLFISSFPILLIVGIWVYFMRQMQGGGGGRGAMSFGKSKARLLGEDQVKVNFSDVAGCDEAKEEVSELVDFLKDPGKFTKLGGKIPRGVLMVGNPGTGNSSGKSHCR